MNTPQNEALAFAIKAAGSQVALCRELGRRQSVIWTWSQGSGPTPNDVQKLVTITKGQRTADQFRPDVFGWQARINDYLSQPMPDDARLAGIDLLWHQISEVEAVHHLMTARGWSRNRARKAVDYLIDNNLSWQVDNERTSN